MGEREQDRDRIRALIEGLCPGTPGLRGAIVEGEPHPQGRPRAHRKSGVLYKLPADRQAEAETMRQLRDMFPEPLLGNLAIACIFYRSTLRRADLDNLMKHVWDAGNRVLWADDSQISAEVGLLELDRDHPRTVVAVCRHESTMWRGPKGGSPHQAPLLDIEPQRL